MSPPSWRFSERVYGSDVAWDLFADLEPLLRGADGFDSLAVEVLDSTGTHTSADIASARAGLTERATTPIRLTATVEGQTGVAGGRTETYVVSIWASEIDSPAGIVVTGQLTATDKASRRPAEFLLYHLKQHVSTFAKHHDVRRVGVAGPDTPHAEGGSPARRARRFLSTQAIALIGGVLASLLAAAILAWATWFFSR